MKTRPSYTVSFQVSLVLSLMTLIALFRAPIHPSDTYIVVSQDQIVPDDLIDIPRTEIKQIPVPVRPAMPVVVAEDVPIEDLPVFDFEFVAGGQLPVPSVPKDDVEEEFILVPEHMPEPIGGMEAIYRRVTYPEIARETGIEGRVVLQFIVDERGNVVNPIVIRGIGGGCDEAALDAIQDVKFKPGLQRGRPVKVQFQLPIVFRLQK